LAVTAEVVGDERIVARQLVERDQPDAAQVPGARDRHRLVGPEQHAAPCVGRHQHVAVDDCDRARVDDHTLDHVRRPADLGHGVGGLNLIAVLRATELRHAVPRLADLQPEPVGAMAGATGELTQ